MLKARDEAFGSFVSRTREDDLVLFISDHGFQSVTRTIHMDHLPKKLGFLEFSGQRHRGRRDGGAPPRSRLPRADQGSIRIESRMARISATSLRGESGDQFASIIRRVPSMSRIQKSSVCPGSE